MDTPSSRNGSYLVYAVGIMALVALVIGIIGMTKAIKADKQLQLVTAMSDRVDEAQKAAATATADAKRASDRVTGLRTDVERVVGNVETAIGNVQQVANRAAADAKTANDKLTELESRGVRLPGGTSAGSAGPTGPAPGTLAEDGTYVIKQGDYFSKLAKEWGCTIEDIERANPGVDSRRLRIGQRLVVPKRQ